MLDAVLAASLAISLLTLVLTVPMLALPASPSELRMWRFLRLSLLRRWITKRRKVNEPFDPQATPAIARRNILWHLFLNSVFTVQLVVALVSRGSGWRPLAPLLVIPCVAYLAGSAVQRHKLVIVLVRKQRASSKN